MYAFVSQSNGHVELASEIGLGTTVTLTFPRSHKPVKAQSARPGPSVEPFDSAGKSGPLGHVLLVEDDRTVAALTMEVLDSIGYDVTSD